jgi:hypothetical protein
VLFKPFSPSLDTDIKQLSAIGCQRRRWEFGNMRLDFEQLRIEDSSLSKAEAAIIRASECGTIEQLVAENERLRLLIVQLLMKNEHLRTSPQDAKST